MKRFFVRLSVCVCVLMMITSMFLCVRVPYYIQVFRYPIHVCCEFFPLLSLSRLYSLPLDYNSVATRIPVICFEIQDRIE